VFFGFFEGLKRLKGVRKVHKYIQKTFT